MAFSIHEHQWVYPGDLALLVGKSDRDVSLRRCEYCTGCSAFRVYFPSGWYAMEGDATKEFLSKFDGEIPGEVYRVAPKEFRPRPEKQEPKRLGRSLKDIPVVPMRKNLFKLTDRIGGK